MAPDPGHKQPMDAEDAERLSQQIDTTQGPGPVLDQNEPTAMPLFNENERAGREVHSVIDPAEFAELSTRGGEELDQIHSIEGGDEPGVAGRAAQVQLKRQDSQQEVAEQSEE
jgi:hypothetical protein